MKFSAGHYDRSVKIQLASTKYPASFVAYDIIYDSGKMTIDLPLMERKKILQETVVENNFISISRYVEENGIALFEAAKVQNLEGIVAKKRIVNIILVSAQKTGSSAR